MNNPRKLPPTWVKFFSWCFAYLTILPLMLTIQLVFFGATYGLSAYGFSLETDSNLLESHTELLPFLLVLAGVLLMGGLTGIFILTWRPYAYNFGIVYCTSAFAAILYGEITNMPSSNGDGALQYLLLICFIIHLIRHRRSWRRTVANPKNSFSSER